MMDVTFDRNDTRSIKGLAIIMMLLHHLAGFSERLPYSFAGFKQPWLHDFANNLSICVGIFLFLSGYGMVKNINRGKFNLLDSIMKLLKSWWKVFAIFVPIGFIFFNRYIPEATWLAQSFYVTSFQEFVTKVVSNLTMTSTSLNGEWWFIRAFVIIMCVAMLYYKCTHKIKRLDMDFLIVILLDITCRSVLSSISTIFDDKLLTDNYLFNSITADLHAAGSFFMGMLFAKYDLLVSFKNLLIKCRFSGVLGLFGFLSVLWARCFVINNWSMDLIFVPLIIIFVSVFFDFVKVLKALFCLLGDYSMNMWLTHSFYCYYFYECTKLVYATQSVVIDLLVLIALSFMTAVLLDVLYKNIGNITKKFKLKISDTME